MFGIFVLLACITEKSPESLMGIDYIKESDNDFYNFLQYVVSPRYKSTKQELIQKQLDKLKLSQEQQMIIWKWIKKEIDFRETEKVRKIS